MQHAEMYVPLIPALSSDRRIIVDCCADPFQALFQRSFATVVDGPNKVPMNNLEKVNIPRYG